LKANKPLKAVSLTALLCLLSLAQAHCVTAEETPAYKETMYVNVFYSAFPGELKLTKNVDLYFKNMRNALPINTSMSAFQNKLQRVECFVEGAISFGLHFEIYYDMDVGNETASRYANEITAEFIKTFGFKGLNRTLEYLNVEGGSIKVHISFPLSGKQQLLEFLKYKPINGFGKFIDGLITKYTTGRTDVGLWMGYYLTRCDSDFLWDLEVQGIDSSMLLPWDVHNYLYTLSVRELLNTSFPIVEQSLEFQRIIVRVQENDTEQLSRGPTTYIITIKSVQPKGYVMGLCEWPNWVEVKYEPLFPIDDIIIEMELDSYTQPNPQKMLIEIAIIAVIVLALLLMVLLYITIRKKRKEDEEWFEKFSRRIGDYQGFFLIKNVKEVKSHEGKDFRKRF